jgi:hypothetical protein
MNGKKFEARILKSFWKDIDPEKAEALFKLDGGLGELCSFEPDDDEVWDAVEDAIAPIARSLNEYKREVVCGALMNLLSRLAVKGKSPKKKRLMTARIVGSALQLRHDGKEYGDTSGKYGPGSAGPGALAQTHGNPPRCRPRPTPGLSQEGPRIAAVGPP